MSVLTRETIPAQSPLESVTANDWVLIKAGSRHMQFAAGAEIIRQDSPGGTMFFLSKGTAKIVVNGETVVAWLAAGQICGEVAFLDNRKSSASVIAEEPVEADAIEWAELHRIFRMFPHVGARFYHSLAVLLSKRLRETSVRLAECKCL